MKEVNGIAFEKRYYCCLNCSDRIECIPSSYNNMLKIREFLIKHNRCSMVCLLTEFQLKEKSYLSRKLINKLNNENENQKKGDVLTNGIQF